MVGVQLPSFIRTVHFATPSWHVDRNLLLELSAFVPIGLFVLFRQLQVYVERFLGSFLTAGSISHLNYSMKTAQVPVTFVLAVSIVSFPVIARLAAAQDRDGMRTSIEHTLRLAIALILPAMAWLIVFSPEIIKTLYMRGEFHADDTAATTGIIRVYTIGLIGQVVVSVAVLAFFAGRSKMWIPVWAAFAGLMVDVVVGLAFLKPLGARSLALGNALGIITMGVLLLVGIDRHIVTLHKRMLVASVLRLCAIAAAAGLTGWVVVAYGLPGDNDALELAVGALVIGAAYVIIGALVHARELDPVFDLMHRKRNRIVASQGGSP